MAGKFKFTFGPWNIHEGEDVFGPSVRDYESLDLMIMKHLLGK